MGPGWEWIEKLHVRRTIWLREVQPGLVASDPSRALLRIGFIIIGTPFARRACPWRGLGALARLLAVCFSLIRYYYATHHPAKYAHWRWLLILGLRSTIIVGSGNILHCQAVATHCFSGYLRNLLLAGGIAAGTCSGLFDQEMLPMSCLTSLVLVITLCWHADSVCHNGLLATEYSAGMTQSVFRSMSTAMDLVREALLTPGFHPTLTTMEDAGATKDLPSCLCMLRFLVVTFGFLLPNTLLYLSENRIIEQSLRHRGDHHGRQEVQWQVGAQRHDDVWVVSVYHLMVAAGAVSVGGAVVWGSLRFLHGV